MPEPPKRPYPPRFSSPPATTASRFREKWPLGARDVGNLDRDSLHLIERDLIDRPIVELRCSRRFVRRNYLRILYRPAILRICRDPRRPESVGAVHDVYVW